jgi:tetratricopeptide (TPR) repeat protein
MRALLMVLVALTLLPAPATAQTNERPGPHGVGWDALRAGEHDVAARWFEQALQARAGDPLLHFGLGVALQGLARTDEARGALERALEIEPRLTPAAAVLGQIVYASGDVEGAIAVYERALARRPEVAGMREQLDRWRREASLHGGFEQGAAGRFQLLFEGAEERHIAERVERVLDAAYWQIGRRLNGYPDRAIQVILYTGRQFQDVTRSPEWAAGAYDGRIRLAVGGALRTPATLDRVVVHELVHAIVQHLAPRGVPAWLHEGLAVHFEEGDERWIDRELRRAARLYPLAALERGFGSLNEAGAALAYAQSAAAARVLVNRLGPNLSAFLQSLPGTASVDEALAIFGFTTADLESATRARARGGSSSY